MIEGRNCGLIGRIGIATNPAPVRPFRAMMCRPCTSWAAALAAVTLVLPSALPASEPAAAATPLARDLARHDGPFGLTRVHQLHLTIARPEWDALKQTFVQGGRGAANGAGAGGGESDGVDPVTGRLYHIGGGFGGYFPWVHADLRFDDEPELKDVGLRHKGNSSYMPTANRLHANFKIKTDLFDAKGSLDGEKTVNLSAGPIDPARLREALSLAIFRAAGVPAPRTAYVEAWLTVPGLQNHTLLGTYTMIENVNKSFAKDFFPPGTGLLLKPERAGRFGIPAPASSWAAMVDTYRPQREATPHEQQRMMEFTNLVHQPDVKLFREKIGQYLDIDNFLRFIAVNALLVNIDSFLGGTHNYFLYLDPKDDRIRFIPWDMDRSFGNMGRGATNLSLRTPYSSDNPLIYWLLDDPAVLNRYRAIVLEILRDVFNATELTKLVNAVEAAVEPTLARESTAKRLRGEAGASPGGDGGLRAFLEDRLYQVNEQIAGRTPGF
jgi:spore coat protein H